MVYRSSATRYRQGTRNGRARRRRRSSISSRIRYQRPNGRNQKRQIQTLARMAMRSSRILNAHRQYQDWTRNSGVTLDINGAWKIENLMDINGWTACLRRDLTPLTQSGCFLREMQFSYFLANDTKQASSTISMFLVTLRNQQNWDGSTMALNDQYCVQGIGSQPILNSAIFKVHWARTHQIFPTLQETVGTGGNLLPTGNPYAQYSKGKTTLKLNFALRSPSELSWFQLSQENMPYYQDLRLLVFFQCSDTDANRSAQISYGTKYTTIVQE